MPPPVDRRRPVRSCWPNLLMAGTLAQAPPSSATSTDEKKDRWKTARVEATAAQGKPRVEVRKRLVVPGALEPFDAPFYIQAEWERQPLLLTQHCYGSYFILKTYVAMLPGTFF